MLAKLIMSTLFGLLYGGLGLLAFLATDVPDAPRMALIVGLASFGLCLLMLQLLEDRMNRRYARAEKQLPPNPLGIFPVNIREQKRITSSNRLYLYQNEIRLVNVDKQTPRFYRIPAENLTHATLNPPVELLLKLTDGHAILLLCPRMEELVRQLRCMGCPVTEKER